MHAFLFVVPMVFLLLAGPGHATRLAAQEAAAFGARHVEQGDANGAVAAYEKAVALDPNNSGLHMQLAGAYGLAAQKAGMVSRMGWAGKARVAYEKAVELDPTNLAAREGLMAFYQMAPSVMGGSMDKAREQAAAIRQLDAVRGHVAFGMIFQAEKNYADAVTEFEAALRAAPGDYAALFQIGRTAALSGQRLERGSEALKRCLAMPPPTGAPGHDAAHWRLGNIHEKRGDKAAARAAYEASLKVNPKFRQATDALAKLD
ncbi:MAG: hypothetical protein C0505_02865 [Leptothrix sp. (in: Bacteria)]|nr:hypothetical protein [Leptothrix sp. (in: b-proteobacteria)]